MLNGGTQWWVDAGGLGSLQMGWPMGLSSLVGFSSGWVDSSGSDFLG